MHNFLKHPWGQVTESLKDKMNLKMNVWICRQATPILNKKGIKARCL